MPFILAYFITFTTYGTWLHGDERRSVERPRDGLGPRVLAPNPRLNDHSSMLLRADPVTLSQRQREAVEDGVRGVIDRRDWRLHAINVRSNHVHLVASAPVAPERVMTDCKAAATKCLRDRKLVSPTATVWTRHGSTRWLNTDDEMHAAIRYTLEAQDRPGFNEPRTQ